MGAAGGAVAGRRHASAAGHPTRRPGGDPDSAGRRLRRRLLRRDPGGHHCGAVVRARTPGPRRAARRRAGRCPPDGRLDDDRRSRGGWQFPAHAATRPPTAHDRRRRGARRRRRRVRPRAVGHRRHRLPAVHVRIHPNSRGRGDHPPVGVHQRRADDPVRRPRLEHPQRQLAAAVPRHGPVDDHVPGAARRSDHADVPGGVRAPPYRWIRSSDPQTCRRSRPHPISRSNWRPSAAYRLPGRRWTSATWRV